MPRLRGVGQDAPATGGGETRCPGYREWGKMPQLRGVGQDAPATGSGARCPSYGGWGNQMPQLRGVGQDAPATGSGARCPSYGGWGNQMPQLRGVGQDAPATGSGARCPSYGGVNVKNFTYPFFTFSQTFHPRTFIPPLFHFYPFHSSLRLRSNVGRDGVESLSPSTHVSIQ